MSVLREVRGEHRKNRFVPDVAEAVVTANKYIHGAVEGEELANQRFVRRRTILLSGTNSNPMTSPIAKAKRVRCSDTNRGVW